MAQSQARDPRLQRAIEDADKYWEQGDKKWFTLLADDVTVYSVASVDPFEGRRAYEEHFTPRLVSGKRRATPLARDVQMLEEGNAVVAQTVEIEEGDVIANIRQSVIWQKGGKGSKGDEWKIKHLHTTLLGTPVPGPRAVRSKSAKGIRVLNEKIATIAAVLGVAQ